MAASFSKRCGLSKGYVKSTFLNTKTPSIGQLIVQFVHTHEELIYARNTYSLVDRRYTMRLHIYYINYSKENIVNTQSWKTCWLSSLFVVLSSLKYKLNYNPSYIAYLTNPTCLAFEELQNSIMHSILNSRKYWYKKHKIHM